MRMASTALSIVPYAVITITSVSGCDFFGGAQHVDAVGLTHAQIGDAPGRRRP